MFNPGLLPKRLVFELILAAVPKIFPVAGDALFKEKRLPLLLNKFSAKT